MRPRSRIRCVASEEEPPATALSLSLQAAPLLIGVGTGAPAFDAIYLPLLLLGRTAEASPAAILFFSTLLYAAGTSLVDAPLSSALLLTAVNLAIAALLLWSETQERAQAETAPTPEDLFASFDRRLARASKDRRSRPPRLCAPRH